ncbi:MAG: hypothetical protein IKP90_02125 [Fibrobacter sp.]|jgi:hypothetical protein|nr:hypothetical protein [Fibrobacter sp.]
MTDFEKDLYTNLCRMILQIRKSGAYSEPVFVQFMMKMDIDVLQKITAIYYLGDPYNTFAEAIQDIQVSRPYDFTKADCIRKMTDVTIDALDFHYQRGLALL